jgi:hypothetical protein
MGVASPDAAILVVDQELAVALACHLPSGMDGLLVRTLTAA